MRLAIRKEINKRNSRHRGDLRRTRALSRSLRIALKTFKRAFENGPSNIGKVHQRVSEASEVSA